jgi:serine/threonine protein kinase
MKTLAEVTNGEFILEYLNGSIRALQILHKTNTAHGELDPSTIQIEDTFGFTEGSLSTRYAAPEITLGLAVLEGYDIPVAVELWKEESNAFQLLEEWFPTLAEEYTTAALYKFIGTPISEQQSDIWSLGICYLFLYDELYKQENIFISRDKNKIT